MRVSIGSLLMAFIFAATVSRAAAQSIVPAEILRVVEAETDAYYTRDIEKWKSAWWHDADVSRTVVSRFEYFGAQGWDQVREQMEQEMRDYPEPMAVEIERDSFIVRLTGDLAWVEFDQTNRIVSDVRRDRTSREQRLMIRRDGVWRLAAQVTSNVRSFQRDRASTEWDFNELGYFYLRAGAVQEAVRIFELNVHLFPESWNVYDSLGEALGAAGRTEEAIANYEKSLSLNPENPWAPAALEKLRSQR